MLPNELHETASFIVRSLGNDVLLTAKSGGEVLIPKVELGEILVAAGILHIARVEIRKEEVA